MTGSILNKLGGGAIRLRHLIPSRTTEVVRLLLCRKFGGCTIAPAMDLSLFFGILMCRQACLHLQKQGDGHGQAKAYDGLQVLYMVLLSRHRPFRYRLFPRRAHQLRWSTGVVYRDGFRHTDLPYGVSDVSNLHSAG